MRGITDGSRHSSPSPARTAIDSSPHSKATLSNGSINGKAASNGVAISHTNGTSPTTLRTTQPTFYGHDREEVTRILIQGLSDLGYEAAAGALSRESGYDLETPYASAFRIAILQGDWEEAEALLSSTYPIGNSSGGVSIATGSEDTLGWRQRSSWTGPKASGGLQLSQDANSAEILFLIRRQKYLELLERRDLSAALMVLRQELQPLNQDERELHALSSFIMCQSSEDLKSQADWDGAAGESRKSLLTELSRFISPSAMIPEHRLAELLTQVKEAQIQHCTYHISPQWPSLYMSHDCDRREFPLDTICELDRHRDEVWYLRFSNDGTRLATASKDCTIVIYETAYFRVLHRLSEHTGSVAYVAWSPDDRRLLSCSQDHTTKLWDTETGTCVRTLKYHDEPVTTAAWAPDGLTFVTGSLDIKRPVTIWSANVGADSIPLHTFEGVCYRVQDCALAAVSPPATSIAAADSSTAARESRPTRLVVVCTNKIIQIFDYAHRVRLSEVQMEYDITCLNLSRDGREMLLNLSSGELWTMGVDDGEVKQKFRGQKQGNFVIRSCFGGASEGCIVSGGEDAKISIWHRYTGRLLEQLEGHRTGCVNAVAWNYAKPSMFASAGDDQKVRVWSKPLPPPQLQQIQQSHSQPATAKSQQGQGETHSFNTSSSSSETPGPPTWGEMMRR